MKPSLQSLNGVDVDDGCTVNSQKPIGVQALLEIFESVAQRMLLRARVELEVVARGLYPVDLRNADEIDSLFGPNGDAILSLAVSSDGFQQRHQLRRERAVILLAKPLQNVLHRAPKSGASERFEQVVNGVNFECAQSESVVGSHENHDRQGGGIDLFENRETVELRHLYIEEHQGWAQGLDF